MNALRHGPNGFLPEVSVCADFVGGGGGAGEGNAPCHTLNPDVKQGLPRPYCRVWSPRGMLAHHTSGLRDKGRLIGTGCSVLHCSPPRRAARAGGPWTAETKARCGDHGWSPVLPRAPALQALRRPGCWKVRPPRTHFRRSCNFLVRLSVTILLQVDVS